MKIGGVYNNRNVFTIRDLEGEIISNGTIEDTLGIEYITGQFKKFYKTKFSDNLSDFELSNEQPVIVQIITYLKSKRKYSNWNMDEFKKMVSENFNPSKSSLDNKYVHLKNIAEKIIKLLN